VAVKPFEIAEFFIEQHGRKAPLPELKRLFETSLGELGLRHFACCQHADLLSPRNATLVFHNLPPEWVQQLSAGGRYRIEPVTRYAEERTVPFLWSDPDFRDWLSDAQRDILVDAERYGLVNGYTVPIHPPGSQPASCSVVPDLGSSIDRSVYPAVFALGCFMFDAMLSASARAECNRTLQARSMQLSARERQCLELAAQGKDDWSIGSLLQISERTAHNHIERAKRRLGVCTRVQVIVHALSEGQISFGAVMRAEPPGGEPRELRKKIN
jgi:DNA-binding CsgD family transcriptional regulator